MSRAWQVGRPPAHPPSSSTPLSLFSRTHRQQAALGGLVLRDTGVDAPLPGHGVGGHGLHPARQADGVKASLDGGRDRGDRLQPGRALPVDGVDGQLVRDAGQQGGNPVPVQQVELSYNIRIAIIKIIKLVLWIRIRNHMDPELFPGSGSGIIVPVSDPAKNERADK